MILPAYFPTCWGQPSWPVVKVMSARCIGLISACTFFHLIVLLLCGYQWWIPCWFGWCCIYFATLCCSQNQLNPRFSRCCSTCGSCGDKLAYFEVKLFYSEVKRNPRSGMDGFFRRFIANCVLSTMFSVGVPCNCNWRCIAALLLVVAAYSRGGACLAVVWPLRLWLAHGFMWKWCPCLDTWPVRWWHALSRPIEDRRTPQRPAFPPYDGMIDYAVNFHLWAADSKVNCTCIC